jgi:hypothetical protein
MSAMTDTVSFMKLHNSRRRSRMCGGESRDLRENGCIVQFGGTQQVWIDPLSSRPSPEGVAASYVVYFLSRRWGSPDATMRGR